MQSEYLGKLGLFEVVSLWLLLGSIVTLRTALQAASTTTSKGSCARTFAAQDIHKTIGFNFGTMRQTRLAARGADSRMTSNVSMVASSRWAHRDGGFLNS
jgi:hypothetical protein